MALITKISPKGIDLAIDMVQRDIYRALTVSISNYESFARCYVVEKDGMRIPTIFNGADYLDVLYDEKYNLTSFFHALDDAEYSEGATRQTVDIIFQGNLKKMFPLIPHRADEEFKSLVDKIFISGERINVRKQTDNVYSEFKFDGSVRDKIIIHNMNDLFLMKFRFKLFFSNSC